MADIMARGESFMIGAVSVFGKLEDKALAKAISDWQMLGVGKGDRGDPNFKPGKWGGLTHYVALYPQGSGESEDPCSADMQLYIDYGSVERFENAQEALFKAVRKKGYDIEPHPTRGPDRGIDGATYILRKR